jgi:CheY-like chemotaxis protein
MDHMMPEMDGFEAVRIIREEIGTSYAAMVPIIALTANAIIGNEELFLKNGFHAFLSKPIDIIQLDAIVNRYVRNKDLEKKLGLSGSLREAGAGGPDSTGKDPRASGKETGDEAGVLTGRSLEGVDLALGLRRFEGNEETYLSVMSSYLAQIQTIAKKGWTCTVETLGDYRLMAHSLKSTCYTIGARHLGSLAEDLEKAALAGNIKYVNAHNGDLMEYLQKIIPVLKNFLEEIKSTHQKPEREAPDPELLARLLEASAAYDMAQMDALMEELEQYRYKSQDDLIVWLRKEFDKSEFENIQKHLGRLNL